MYIWLSIYYIRAHYFIISSFFKLQYQSNSSRFHRNKRKIICSKYKSSNPKSAYCKLQYDFGTKKELICCKMLLSMATHFSLPHYKNVLNLYMPVCRRVHIWWLIQKLGISQWDDMIFIFQNPFLHCQTVKEDIKICQFSNANTFFPQTNRMKFWVAFEFYNFFASFITLTPMSRRTQVFAKDWIAKCLQWNIFSMVRQ